MNVFGFASAVTLARSIGQIGRRASVPLAAIAIAAVVAGCAAPAGPRSDDLVCNSAQQCRVTVRVDCNPGCTASVDHPRVMARGNDIVWIVANKPGQSYAFRAQDGVFFKTEAGRNVFRCHREAAAERYACMNRRDPGTYEYGIRLDGSPPVPVLDPWVVN
jgi:hypothetical protein